MKPKCLRCKRNRALLQTIVGYVYCKKCIDEQRALPSLGETIEMTTPEIKEDRKKYQRDILQSRRGGQLSKEFIKAYPETVEKMRQEGTVTEQEIRQAKNVWDHNYYREE